MQTARKNSSGKAPAHKTIAAQTAAIEALESSIDEAMELDPQLKQCLVMKAAKAHLKALKEVRAEQIADEANLSKRHRDSGTGTSRHSH